MVKGVSRRVVVVRPDECGIFEQAIFLVRDYETPRRDVVREACRIANSYLTGPAARSRSGPTRWSLALVFAAGVLVTSVVWAAVVCL
nr:hypothetical protein [uncultured Agathobaculum sp.]